MKIEKTMVSIWIKPEILDKLDKFAEKAKISRSKLIINLIIVGCDEMKMQSNLGIIKLTLKLRSLQRRIDLLLTGADQDIVVEDQSPRGTNVSVRIDKDLIKKVDELANKIKMTRSTFLEYVLDLSITDLKILDFIHVTDGVILLNNLISSVKNKWQQAFKESYKRAKAQQVVITSKAKKKE